MANLAITVAKAKIKSSAHHSFEGCALGLLFQFQFRLRLIDIFLQLHDFVDGGV